MAHPQSTSHESLTIAINLRKAANRLPYMNAERMAAFSFTSGLIGVLVS